jgi:uncharacterized protein (TIGR02118 family)
MFKLIRLVRRRPHLTPDEFSRWWSEVHGPQFRETHAVSRHVAHYVQNHIKDSRGSDPGRPFDGIAEITFFSKESFEAFAAEPLTAKLREDEGAFIDLGAVFVAFVDVKFSMSN